MNKVQLRRLNNVVKVLTEASETSENDCNFNMCEYFDECGTPACVLGHYAARPDVQRAIRPGKRRNWSGSLMPVSTKTGRRVNFQDAVVVNHFGITLDEADRLFSSSGCGDAATTEQAAKYIKRFIERKLAEQK